MNNSDSSAPLRITVWGINYAPELTGIAPYNVLLCEFLRRQGHDVEMVTTFSYYPAWRKRPEDRGQLYRRDQMNAVPVHRCWHYVPPRVSTLKRILHEATFVFSSVLRLLGLPRAEVLVVVSPPLLLGAAAWVVGALKGTPFVFHVQDLQPDAALGLGMLRQGWLARALYGLEALAYRKAARVSGISRGMLDAFASKGVPEKKQVYFPNSVTPVDLAALPTAGAFRAREQFATDDFLAIYSGNLGMKQGLRVLIEAAALVQDQRIQIVICGDGVERTVLTQMAAERQLRNVRLLPLQPQEHYAEMLVDADLCLITQQAGSGRAFFPSKLLATLNYARPVLTVADADSELARARDEAGFGVNVLPDQPAALACQLEALAAAPAQLGEMARRGRKYVEQFAADRVFGDFEQRLREVAAEGYAKK